MINYKESFLKELDLYGGALPMDRYYWMKGVSRDECPLEKMYVINGYLMAMENLGYNIGYLREFLLSIIEEKEKENR